jgi:hypothetical protein
MVLWLDNTVPPWLMGLFIVGGGTLLTWVAIRIRHNLAKPGEAESGSALNDLAAVFVLIVAGMYGILVAFMILIVWDNIDRADKAASMQGGIITALARQSIALPQPGQGDLQDALRAYAESVKRDEWPTMAHGQSNAETVRLFNHIFVVADHLPDGIAASAIRTELGSLSEARTALLLDSGLGLPGAFWFTLILGAVAALALSVLFLTETPRAHGLMAVAFAALICGSLWLILEADYPVSGSGLGVRPDAFERALSSITALQAGQL